MHKTDVYWIKRAIAVVCLAAVAYPVYMVGMVFLTGGGAASDFTCSLPNGYSLIRANAGDTWIYGPHNQAIPPNIHEIQIIGKWVVGHAWTGAEDAVVGYFILDTESEEREFGLSKAEWIRELKERNLETPVLDDPKTVCDRWAESGK